MKTLVGSLLAFVTTIYLTSCTQAKPVAKQVRPPVLASAGLGFKGLTRPTHPMFKKHLAKAHRPKGKSTDMKQIAKKHAKATRKLAKTKHRPKHLAKNARVVRAKTGVGKPSDLVKD